MSDEYIKKEDAVNLFEALADSLDTFEFRMAAIGAANELRKMPSMCFAPVRHGQWEVIDAEEPRRYGCSECKRLSWHIENYCPNCGAKMGEEEINE